MGEMWIERREEPHVVKYVVFEEGVTWKDSEELRPVIAAEVWPERNYGYGHSRGPQVSWPSTSDKRPAVARQLARALLFAAAEADGAERDVSTGWPKCELEPTQEEWQRAVEERILTAQREFILERFGQEAADAANYGWETDDFEGCVTTKVYLHGVVRSWYDQPTYVEFTDASLEDA